MEKLTFTIIQNILNQNLKEIILAMSPLYLMIKKI